MEDWFPDIDAVASDCRKRRVKYVVNSGLESETNRKALEASKKHKLFLPALGLYPGEASEKSEKELESEIGFLRENISKGYAVGEIGLDGTYPFIEKQKKWLSKLLEIAAKESKPAIIHSRKAEKDVIECISEEAEKKKPGYNKIVMHCFMGNMKLVKRCAELGWFFSIPAICGRSEHFKSIIRTVPMRQLLTETDSPFLAPARGETNYPWNVKVAIREIAKIKQITEEECEKIVFMNFSRLFLV
jgi:TatD DNase family protein